MHFAFVLPEGGFPLAQFGLPLLQSPVATAELGIAAAELALLLQVPHQLLLDQIDEEIDFLLVVTALADAWPRKRDVVDIGRSESHFSALLP